MGSIDEILKSLEKKREQVDAEVNSRNAAESIGKISILVTSYSTLLSHHKRLLEEMAEDEYKRHSLLLAKYKKQINDMSVIAKKNSNEDVAGRPKDASLSYAENVNTQITEDESFVSTNTRRLNSYLVTAIDSLDSLKQQGKVLSSTREKILGGLRKMGIGNDLVEKIGDRYSNDKIMYTIGLTVVILVFFLLRFVIK